MTATLSIIKSKVGSGGQVTGTEVQRVLRLLARARFLPTTASLTHWSAAAAEACRAFHRSIGYAERADFDPGIKSDAMLELCKKADVALPLKYGARGAAAFMAFWDECVQRKVPYCWSEGDNTGEDRLAFGLDGYEHYLVFTQPGANARVDPDPAKPGIGMNCISFVNLSLSIWRTGRAHASPYDVDQRAGGFDPITNRYGLQALCAGPFSPQRFGNPAGGVPVPPLLQVSKVRQPVQIERSSLAAWVADTYFYDSSDVLRVTEPGRLYYLQWCYPNARTTKKGVVLAPGFGHHDTVLLNGEVFEINSSGGVALRRTPLGRRMNWGGAATEAVRVFGPA